MMMMSYNAEGAERGLLPSRSNHSSLHVWINSIKLDLCNASGVDAFYKNVK